jgi:hypothetical protein
VRWGAGVLGIQVAFLIIPYCHAPAGGTLLWLHMSSCCVISSDYRTIVMSPGCIRSGKLWEGGWTSAVLCGGTVRSRSSGGIDWALSLLESAPWSRGWGLQSVGEWRVATDREPWAPSCAQVRGLHPSPQPRWETLSANSCLQTEVAGESPEYLWSLCQDWELLCSVPTNPYWHLASLWVHQVEGKHGLNSMPCPFNAVLLSAANQSLNFHESRTLPHSLETWIHMCTWLASERRGTLFALPDLTVNFHSFFVEHYFIMKWWLT